MISSSMRRSPIAGFEEYGSDPETDGGFYSFIIRDTDWTMVEWNISRRLIASPARHFADMYLTEGPN